MEKRIPSDYDSDEYVTTAMALCSFIVLVCFVTIGYNFHAVDIIFIVSWASVSCVAIISHFHSILWLRDRVRGSESVNMFGLFCTVCQFVALLLIPILYVMYILKSQSAVIPVYWAWVALQVVGNDLLLKKLISKLS